jgi:hypothetical protein
VRVGYVLFLWEESGDFSDKDWGIGAGGDSEGTVNGMVGR